MSKSAKEINILRDYVSNFSKYIEEIPFENPLFARLFAQVFEITSAIEHLLKEKYIWPAVVLKRTLGELTLFIFVLLNLKDDQKKSYLAIYELHGLYEMLDVFEISDYNKYKSDPSVQKLNTKIKQLEGIVHKDYGVNERKIKKFVETKLSKYIYQDAQMILDHKYAEHTEIRQAVQGLLKRAEYKVESNFTHGKFISTFVNDSNSKEFEKLLIKSVTERLHLIMAIHDAHKK